MKIACFGILIAICLVLDIMYGIFAAKNSSKSNLVKSLSILSLIVLSLVLSMIQSLSNTFVVFISLSFTFLLTSGLLTDEYKLLKQFFSLIATILISLSAFSLAGFNLWALVAGLLLGLAFGVIATIYNKESKLTKFLNFVELAFIGLALAFAVPALIETNHMLSVILMISGLAFVFVRKFAFALGIKNIKAITIFDEMELVGLAIACAAIFVF